VLLALAATLLAAACRSDVDPGSGALVDGTPDAVGVLGLLNDPATTFTVLDVDAGLDRRAAENLTAHRDGPDGAAGTADDDRFDTIEEVDAVPYVGPAMLDRLLAFARERGFVPAGDDVLGVWDEVAFTVDEAEATLAWVNAATEEELDEVLRDSRPVNSILEARPLASMLEVSELYFVGPTMMQRLRDAAAPAAGGELATLPAATGYGASCDAALAPFFTEAPTSDDTVTLTYWERCTMDPLSVRAMDHWREHWIAEDQPWEWDEGGPYPRMNVRRQGWADGRTRITIDIGADEDEMYFHFDASEALVHFVHEGQSSNQSWFCAAPGDDTAGEPDVDCVVDAMYGTCEPYAP